MNRYYYLIIIYRFSTWPEIYKFRHPTSTNTIKALGEIFSSFRVPEILVSDNGTMFMGKEFKDYCSSLAIEHITAPAYNPESNGLAERFVDTFKGNIKKEPRTRYGRTYCTEISCCIQDHTELLAAYRITPNFLLYTGSHRTRTLVQNYHQQN